MSDTAALYAAKAAGYFSAPRLDLLEFLPTGGGLSLLELGAGTGATLGEAKRRGLAAHVVGVDIVAPAKPDDALDAFVVANLETAELGFAEASFDVLLCGDVLEHLVDPWQALRRAAGWLRPGGRVVSSIPNIRNHRALAQIVVRGDFRYADAGLLDRSHLRFFCRRNVRALHEQAGLVVERTAENMGGYGLRHRAIDLATFGLLHDFFVFQFLTVARKP